MSDKVSYGLDILAVGDVVTDAFIRLGKHEAEVSDVGKEHHPLLCMTYGSKIPFDDVTIIPAVGNSANAAVAAARLGLRVAFYSNVGGDQVGKDIIRALHARNISTEYVRINEGKKSNYHYVLWYGADRTILIKHERVAQLRRLLPSLVNQRPRCEALLFHVLDYHQGLRLGNP